MNGTKPKFMEIQVPAQSYFEQPNPYVNAPVLSCEFASIIKICKEMWKEAGRAYTGRSEKIFNLENGGSNPATSVITGNVS